MYLFLYVRRIFGISKKRSLTAKSVSAMKALDETCEIGLTGNGVYKYEDMGSPKRKIDFLGLI